MPKALQIQTDPVENLKITINKSFFLEETVYIYIYIYSYSMVKREAGEINIRELYL